MPRMSEHNQILIPPSFLEVYSDGRQRLTASEPEVRQRYELCEDLAGHLVEQAERLYHVEAPSEEGILLRMHAGLCSPASGVSQAEAKWIICRLAELLNWRCPVLGATA